MDKDRGRKRLTLPLLLQTVSNTIGITLEDLPYIFIFISKAILIVVIVKYFKSKKNKKVELKAPKINDNESDFKNTKEYVKLMKMAIDVNRKVDARFKRMAEKKKRDENYFKKLNSNFSNLEFTSNGISVFNFDKYLHESDLLFTPWEKKFQCYLACRINQDLSSTSDFFRYEYQHPHKSGHYAYISRNNLELIISENFVTLSNGIDKYEMNKSNIEKFDLNYAYDGRFKGSIYFTIKQKPSYVIFISSEEYAENKLEVFKSLHSSILRSSKLEGDVSCWGAAGV